MSDDWNVIPIRRKKWAPPKAPNVLVDGYRRVAAERKTAQMEAVCAQVLIAVAQLDDLVIAGVSRREMRECLKILYEYVLAYARPVSGLTNRTFDDVD